MSRILLTHSPEALRNYYGARALAGLRALAEVKLHGGPEPLMGDALIAAAADCAVVVSYRQSPAPAALFERLPGLVAFVRCAIDIRNIDVAAASKADVIATPHTAGLTLPAIEHQSLETVAQAGEILKGRVPSGSVNAGHWRRQDLLRR